MKRLCARATRRTMFLRSCSIIAMTVLGAAGCARRAPEKPFSQQRAEYRTVLAKHGPAPQDYEPWSTTEDPSVRTYKSAGREFKGVLLFPESNALARGARVPLLVYLHGGFALGQGDLGDCGPFLDAGFAVFAPTLRGENGNPGEFEFAYGELDDALAAIAFASKLDGIDPKRVVVFGHSAGGMLSLLASLYPSLPVLDMGSAGGIYGPELFDHMPGPFSDAPIERKLRTFTAFAGQLQRHHFACVGLGDQLGLPSARGVSHASSFLEVLEIPGDHQASLPGCMKEFLSRVLPKVR